MPETNRGIRQTRGDGGPVKAIRFPAAMWALVEAAAANSDSRYSKPGASEVVRAAVAAFVGAETNAGRWYTIKSHDGAEIPATAKCNTRGSGGDPDDKGHRCADVDQERDELRRQVAELERELANVHGTNTDLNKELEKARWAARSRPAESSAPDFSDVAVLQAVEDFRAEWDKARNGRITFRVPPRVGEAAAALWGALDARGATEAPAPIDPFLQAAREAHEAQDSTSALIQDAIQNPGRSAKPARARRRK